MMITQEKVNIIATMMIECRDSKLAPLLYPIVMASIRSPNM
jgi:hypothetical protein